MAEVLGTVASGLTVAALFKACLGAFDLVQAARHQEADYKRLLLKLNIEKCRLYVWGDTLRLTSGSETTEARPLDSFQFRHLVAQMLGALHDLFNDSQKIKEVYGCREATALDVDSVDNMHFTGSLAAAFSQFQSGSHDKTKLKLGRKAVWVIRDRNKFAELISEIKELIDGLQEVTKSIAPILLQQAVITNRISTIVDNDTLELISEVSEDDHPIISNAASLKSEILSMSDHRRAEIEAWVADGPSLLDPEVLDIENLDLSEMKHHMLSLINQRRQLENALAELSADQKKHFKEKLMTTKFGAEETMSMKVIAMVSMAFLPGTFVSTFLNMADLDAVRLFLGISVPMTGTSLMIWLLLYMRDRSQNRSNATDQMGRTIAVPMAADQLGLLDNTALHQNSDNVRITRTRRTALSNV